MEQACFSVNMYTKAQKHISKHPPPPNDVHVMVNGLMYMSCPILRTSYPNLHTYRSLEAPTLHLRPRPSPPAAQDQDLECTRDLRPASPPASLRWDLESLEERRHPNHLASQHQDLGSWEWEHGIYMPAELLHASSQCPCVMLHKLIEPYNVNFANAQ